MEHILLGSKEYVSPLAQSYTASGRYNKALYPGNQILLSNHREVIWIKNQLLIRRHTSDEDTILNAFVVKFRDSQAARIVGRPDAPVLAHDYLSKIALAVVYANRAYFHFLDDEIFSVNFPFSMTTAMRFQFGIVLERKVVAEPASRATSGSTASSDSSGASSHSKANFVTILDPLDDLGIAVSSSTSSFSPTEQLVWFPPNAKTSFAVTFNLLNNIIAIYHVRFLSHSRNKVASGPKRSSIRKRSLSRKSSIPTSVIEAESREASTELGSKYQIRRSVSHSEMLSYDRMASGTDVTMDTDSSGTNAGLLPAGLETSFRKDIVLTKIEKVQFSGSRADLKIFSLRYLEQQGIAIVNTLSTDTEVLMFKSSNNSVSLPSYQRSFSFKCVDAIALSSADHEGFIIGLNQDRSSVKLINPFLNITSHELPLNHAVQTLDDCEDHTLAFTTTSQEFCLTKLLIQPFDQLTKRCLECLKHVCGPYVYEYIWLKWCASKSLSDTDWDALIITILSIVIPSGTDFTNMNVKNSVTAQLANTVKLNHSNGNLLSQVNYKKLLSDLTPNIALGLHLLLEELKLNVVEQCENLRLLLAQLSIWMSWPKSWAKHYLVNNLDPNPRFSAVVPLQSPPNLLQSLCSIFSNSIIPYVTISQLAEENDSVDEIVTPRTYYVLRIFEAIVSSRFSATDVVSLIVEYKIDQFQLDTYPIGVSALLKEYLISCKNTATLSSSLEFIDLVDRKDLKMILTGKDGSQRSFGPFSHLVGLKDTNQIIQSIKLDEPTGAWDGHTETDRLNITKLIFSSDRRFYEITKLLQSSKVQTVTLKSTSDLNEYDLLQVQQELSKQVSLRTLTVSLGRGILFFSSRIPILTEKFPIPKLNFDIVIQPANTTLTLNKDALEEKLSDWGYFHNGASSGLTILRDAKNIVGSWIEFNKPAVHNSQHGGFLLGLGLNGHLKNLEKWNMYNYLGPKHSHTSVGLLIGISASSKGSMDMKLTKVLSVHVIALLPHGATDMNVSLPVQTAGLIGIGLLYLETQHHRMSEILLSQISASVSFNDRVVVDEGYRLAAGIALGYVNLGKGNDLIGLSDTHITDKLLSMAISLRDVQTSHEHDKSAPGAIIALGLIYLRTNNQGIAEKLALPDTIKLLDYTRSDLLLLRIVAKNLILFDEIGKTKDWVTSQIPHCLQTRYALEVINFLDSDHMGYFNCIGGACLAIGLKYSSTSDLKARDTVMYLLDQFMRITALPCHTFDEKIAQSSATKVQDVLALSLSLIMAGTGNLETFRRLRILHNRINKDVIYSNYVALSMALGFLFIGSGEYAFEDTNFAVAALLTAVYPSHTSKIEESQTYLEALRHFWALAVSPRCLVTREVNTLKPVKVPIEIGLKDGSQVSLTAPCLVPKLKDITSIKTVSADYFDINVDFSDSQEMYERLSKNFTLYVYDKKLTQDGSDQTLLHAVVQNISNEFNDNTQSQTEKAFESLFENDAKRFTSDSFKLEISQMVTSPKSADDLWNVKLIFAFHDKIDSIDCSYLTSGFIELLKAQLWKFSTGLH